MVPEEASGLFQFLSILFKFAAMVMRGIKGFVYSMNVLGLLLINGFPVF